MEAIYHFYWDCGRQGSLEGTFVADTEEVQNAIGQTIYFGEVLGKHSEIVGELEESDLEILSTDSKDIEVIKRLKLDHVGYNPLHYLSEDDED